MTIEDLNKEVEIGANENIDKTLALFFDKLYQATVSDQTLVKDPETKKYLDALYEYVRAKLALHRAKKRAEYISAGYYTPVLFNYRTLEDNINFYKVLKNKLKKELEEKGVEAPKINAIYYRR